MNQAVRYAMVVNLMKATTIITRKKNSIQPMASLPVVTGDRLTVNCYATSVVQNRLQKDGIPEWDQVLREVLRVTQMREWVSNYNIVYNSQIRLLISSKRL